MIRPLFLFWYSVGLILMLTIGVPHALAFSNGLFLVFFAAYALSIERSIEGRAALKAGRAILVGVVTWAIEAFGIATGFPFGEYAYTPVLGWSVLGVPLAIACAWMAVVTLGVLLSVGRSRWQRALLVGGWTVLFDLVLDPVAYARGFWIWSGGGYYGVPLTNFAAWFVISAALSLLYPVRSLTAGKQREAVRLMQLMMLMFGVLGIQEGLTAPPLIALAGIGLAEGVKRIDTSKQKLFV